MSELARPAGDGPPLGRDHARACYDAFAPFYDDFTAHHDYDMWTTTLEALAVRAGLHGRRLLDVACGTGKSFAPFLERGYQVRACDVSAAMLARAEMRARGRAQLDRCDMRELPTFGAFDLVCCLDDAVNYLHTPAELTAALIGMRRNLAPEGILVFDVNTLRAYRSFYATATVVPTEERVLVWSGRASGDFRPGDLAEAEHIAYERRDDGFWSRSASLHRQRHHPEGVVRAALARAGLSCVAVYGMHLDGSFDEGADEQANSKAVYIARANRAPEQPRR